MSDKTRRTIIFEAARLLYLQKESEFYRAKLVAARKVVGGWARASDLPTNQEILDELRVWARLHGNRQSEREVQRRLTALRLMQLLDAFAPRLIVPADDRQSPPDLKLQLELWAAELSVVRSRLDEIELEYQVLPTPENLIAEGRVLGELRVEFECDIHMRVLARKFAGLPGPAWRRRTAQRFTTSELSTLLAEDPSFIEFGEATDVGVETDRFQVYESLLLPLEHVKQNPKRHPEGSVLAHSLQVFMWAREELPYDEEFLLAALLHDVGKGIDPRDPIVAALTALQGHITERTAWLIEHHHEGLALRQGRLGIRSRRRLEAHESFAELETLALCDRWGRCRGTEVIEVDEALAYVHELAAEND